MRPLRTAAVRALYGAAGKDRWHHHRLLRQHDTLSPERLQALHGERLAALLTHARDHVPYYRMLMAEHSVDPRIDDPVDVLQALPVLTRERLRRNVGSLITETADRRRLYKNATGGSTGEPVDFYQDRPFREIAQGSRLRAWGWSGFTPGSRVAWIWGAPQETGPARSLAGALTWRLVNRRLYDAFRAGPTEMRRWSRDMARFQPEFVVGYASALESFARLVLAEGLSVPAGVHVVFSTAEQLLPAQRQVIERAFGCPVRDQYGCREVPAIAAECPHGHMHVATDVVHVEFQATAASSAPELSRVLVTPLFAFGMPLVRYDLGDLGCPIEGACPCGLPYPLMRLGAGRTSDVFVTPSGKLLHGEYFTHLLYGVPGVARFQFEQTQPDLIRLAVVPDAAFGDDTQRFLDALQPRIQREVSAQMRLTWEARESIPLTATGKFRFTRSNLGAAALAEVAR